MSGPSKIRSGLPPPSRGGGEREGDPARVGDVSANDAARKASERLTALGQSSAVIPRELNKKQVENFVEQSVPEKIRDRQRVVRDISRAVLGKPPHERGTYLVPIVLTHLLPGFLSDPKFIATLSSEPLRQALDPKGHRETLEHNRAVVLHQAVLFMKGWNPDAINQILSNPEKLAGVFVWNVYPEVSPQLKRHNRAEEFYNRILTAENISVASEWRVALGYDGIVAETARDKGFDWLSLPGLSITPFIHTYTGRYHLLMDWIRGHLVSPDSETFRILEVGAGMEKHESGSFHPETVELANLHAKAAVTVFDISADVIQSLSRRPLRFLTYSQAARPVADPKAYAAYLERLKSMGPATPISGRGAVFAEFFVEAPDELASRIKTRQLDVATESFGGEEYDLVTSGNMEFYLVTKKTGPLFALINLIKMISSVRLDGHLVLTRGLDEFPKEDELQLLGLEEVARFPVPQENMEARVYKRVSKTDFVARVLARIESAQACARSATSASSNITPLPGSLDANSPYRYPRKVEATPKNVEAAEREWRAVLAEKSLQAETKRTKNLSEAQRKKEMLARLGIGDQDALLGQTFFNNMAQVYAVLESGLGKADSSFPLAVGSFGAGSINMTSLGGRWGHVALSVLRRYYKLPLSLMTVEPYEILMTLLYRQKNGTLDVYDIDPQVISALSHPTGEIIWPTFGAGGEPLYKPDGMPGDSPNAQFVQRFLERAAPQGAKVLSLEEAARNTSGWPNRHPNAGDRAFHFTLGREHLQKLNPHSIDLGTDLIPEQNRKLHVGFYLQTAYFMDPILQRAAFIKIVNQFHGHGLLVSDYLLTDAEAELLGLKVLRRLYKRGLEEAPPTAGAERDRTLAIYQKTSQAPFVDEMMATITRAQGASGEKPKTTGRRARQTRENDPHRFPHEMPITEANALAVGQTWISQFTRELRDETRRLQALDEDTRRKEALARLDMGDDPELVVASWYHSLSFVFRDLRRVLEEGSFAGPLHVGSFGAGFIDFGNRRTVVPLAFGKILRSLGLSSKGASVEPLEILSHFLPPGTEGSVHVFDQDPRVIEALTEPTGITLWPLFDPDLEPLKDLDAELAVALLEANGANPELRGYLGDERSRHALQLLQIPAPQRQKLHLHPIDLATELLPPDQKLHIAFYRQVSYFMPVVLQRATFIKIVDRVEVKGFIVSDFILSAVEAALLGLKRVQSYTGENLQGEFAGAEGRDTSLYIYQKVIQTPVVGQFLDLVRMSQKPPREPVVRPPKANLEVRDIAERVARLSGSQDGASPASGNPSHVSSTVALAALPLKVAQSMEDHPEIYWEHSCFKNVYDLIRINEEAILSPQTRVLFLIPRTTKTKKALMSGDGFVPLVPTCETEPWGFHIVLEVEGRIFDWDYAGEPGQPMAGYLSEQFGDRQMDIVAVPVIEFMQRAQVLLEMGHLFSGEYPRLTAENYLAELKQRTGAQERLKNLKPRKEVYDRHPLVLHTEIKGETLFVRYERTLGGEFNIFSVLQSLEQVGHVPQGTSVTKMDVTVSVPAGTQFEPVGDISERVRVFLEQSSFNGTMVFTLRAGAETKLRRTFVRPVVVSRRPLWGWRALTAKADQTIPLAVATGIQHVDFNQLYNAIHTSDKRREFLDDAQWKKFSDAADDGTVANLCEKHSDIRDGLLRALADPAVQKYLVDHGGHEIFVSALTGKKKSPPPSGGIKGGKGGLGGGIQMMGNGAELAVEDDPDSSPKTAREARPHTSHVPPSWSPLPTGSARSFASSRSTVRAFVP